MLFQLISGIVKYIFVTVIYFFMFSIIRLMYLDIRQSRGTTELEGNPYFKLVNRRSTLDFRVEESYFLKDGVVFGRGRKSDIIIPDPFLSSKQAQIIKYDDYWAIQDLGSTNGTSINGEPLTDEPSALKMGDLIHLGQLDFVFVDDRR